MGKRELENTRKARKNNASYWFSISITNFAFQKDPSATAARGVAKGHNRD